MSLQPPNEPKTETNQTKPNNIDGNNEAAVVAGTNKTNESTTEAKTSNKGGSNEGSQYDRNKQNERNETN